LRHGPTHCLEVVFDFIGFLLVAACSCCKKQQGEPK